ncbi:MAG: methylated-DNA--[protein]-cysteine S-methyltransferase [Eubacteriales bacterium]|nr:methylated-DNA--[protein]-cysteine S-methyltransferase [Eubacteriales bacterium]
MKTRQEALEYALSFPGTYTDTPFRETNRVLVRVKGSRKAFLWSFERNGRICLNLKAGPDWRDLWRGAYAAVLPAYHQNKEHWNTVILDGTIPDEEIRRMIAHSYDLITDTPSKRIYEAVRRIPKGHVATYAQVAEMAGNKKMSRAVGNALHRNPDPDTIPCFRVVNAQGKLSGNFAFGEGVQERLLREDGVEVVDGQVDLKIYGIAVADGMPYAEAGEHTDL